MLGCANVSPAMLDSSSSGILKIFPKLDVIDHNIDINENLDVTFGIDKYGIEKYDMEPNMNNTSSIVSLSWNFESENTFSDELETNKICASEVSDENPETNESYYVDVGLVIYDEYHDVDDHDPVLREVALNLDYICSKQIDNNSCDVLAMNCR
ncbi:hypothetical protein LIER_42969 [Lithospermum erythrorhizon]|uniref:Uncharacterized protein n=1 Tax=Lithospermum erythrorhizon TaxID=34254 RepID=A0AAV3PA23_LITER